MTPDEARRFLQSGRELASFERWTEVYNVLHAVQEAAVLTGDEQGEVGLLLGKACLNTHGEDAAHYYLDQVVQGGGTHAAEARQLLAEIGRIDAASNAEHDGVAQNEAAAVLAAADDAYARHAFADALGHYRAAYRGTVDGEPKNAATLGIANCLAHTGELVEARQYAEYVVNAGGQHAAAATQLIEWIDHQRQASHDTADGADPNEYHRVRQAGRDAYFSGAYQQALDHWRPLADSDRIAGTDRAAMASNSAMALRMLGDDTTARTYFEYALAHGRPDTVAVATRQLELLTRNEQAVHDAEALTPD